MAIPVFYIFVNIYCLSFILAILVDMHWYLIVFLICIFIKWMMASTFQDAFFLSVKVPGYKDIWKLYILISFTFSILKNTLSSSKINNCFVISSRFVCVILWITNFFPIANRNNENIYIIEFCSGLSNIFSELLSIVKYL